MQPSESTLFKSTINYHLSPVIQNSISGFLTLFQHATVRKINLLSSILRIDITVDSFESNGSFLFYFICLSFQQSQHPAPLLLLLLSVVVDFSCVAA